MQNAARKDDSTVALSIVSFMGLLLGRGFIPSRQDYRYAPFICGIEENENAVTHTEVAYEASLFYLSSRPESRTSGDQVAETSSFVQYARRCGGDRDESGQC